MAKLMNYLAFENANEAITYYETVFNAKLLGKIPLSQEQVEAMKIDKKPEDTVMHASISILGNTINCSDNMNGSKSFGNAFSMLLDFNSEDTDEMKVLEDLYKQVTDDSATVITMPLAEQFWGGKMGMLIDKYGIQWMFHAQPYSKLESFGEMK